MSNKNQNFSSCAFAEEMIAFLYGEAGADESKKCEAHLRNCGICAEELAGFGAARTAFLEWREEDFSSLATPVFQIPGVQTAAAASEKYSWSERFKNLFAFNPAMATAALTVLIVSVSAFVLMFNFFGNREVVEIVNEKNSTQASVSPTIETQIIKEEKKFNADKTVVSEEKPSVVKVDSSPETKREKEIAPDKAVVKIPNNAPKNNVGNSLNIIKGTKNDVKKPSSARKQAVPNLDEIEDDEDDSIRLSDLFAELDTK